MSKYRIIKNNDPDLRGWHKRALAYIIQYQLELDGKVRWMNDGYAKSIAEAEKEILRRQTRAAAREELKTNPNVVRSY